MTSDSGRRPTDADALRAHVEDCEQCGPGSVDAAAVSNALRVDEAPVDAIFLSRVTLERLRPELARRAALVFRRRVATGLIAALIPLPAVLLFDAYVLRALFGLVSLLVPTTLAAYVVVSYATFLLLITASVYGAIPLLVERQVAARAATTS